jgi:hypothetical protein
MTNALPEDETTFTCVAKNSAGEVAKGFKLKVLGNLNKDQSTKMDPGSHGSGLVMHKIGKVEIVITVFRFREIEIGVVISKSIFEIP